MRQILHPGPAVLERTKAVEGSPVRLRFSLAPGCSVDEAIATGFEAAGCAGGFVTLRGGQCEPFRYVIPAASPNAQHAAWYSATYAPTGQVAIDNACAIVGFRDGKRFIHCHGIWDTGNGPRMGHLLAPDTKVVEPVEVEGIGMRTATFQAQPDPETNFTLFEPVPLSASDATVTGRALLAKVRPNQDIGLAIEEICAKHGIRAANIFGIGSLNEVRFAEGCHVRSHATEVSIRNGSVASVDGWPQARLHIDVVDMNGDIFSGHLVRGENPVCVTFELVIEETGRA
jgi:predicted DNA-binding protein with PD1-like motif